MKQISILCKDISEERNCRTIISLLIDLSLKLTELIKQGDFYFMHKRMIQQGEHSTNYLSYSHYLNSSSRYLFTGSRILLRILTGTAWILRLKNLINQETHLKKIISFNIPYIPQNPAYNSRIILLNILRLFENFLLLLH